VTGPSKVSLPFRPLEPWRGGAVGMDDRSGTGEEGCDALDAWTKRNAESVRMEDVPSRWTNP